MIPGAPADAAIDSSTSADGGGDGPVIGGDSTVLFEVEAEDTGDAKDGADACVTTSCPVTPVASSTVCGASVVISPFYARTGGFTSSAGGAGSISVSFSKTSQVIQSVTVTVHGATVKGARMMAYDGVKLVGTVNFDISSGASTKTITGPLTMVQLVPGSGDSVWYDKLSFELCK